jgi:hypothetical protein
MSNVSWVIAPVFASFNDTNHFAKNPEVGGSLPRFETNSRDKCPPDFEQLETSFCLLISNIMNMTAGQYKRMNRKNVFIPTCDLVINHPLL